MHKHFFQHLLLSLAVASFSAYLDVRIYYFDNFWIYLCTALVTFWVYSLDYIRDTQGKQDASTWIFLALFAIALAGLSASTERVLPALTFLLFLGVFSLYAYPLPFLKKKKGESGVKIKAIKGLKSIIITVGYLLFLNLTLLAVDPASLGRTSLQNFVFGNGFLAALIMMNTNFGDLRDVRRDREEGTKTLGTLLGVKGLALTLLLCSALLFFVAATLFEFGFAIPFAFYFVFALVLCLFYAKVPRTVYSLLDFFLFMPFLGELMFL